MLQKTQEQDYLPKKRKSLKRVSWHIGLLIEEGVEVEFGLLHRGALRPPWWTCCRDGLRNVFSIAAAKNKAASSGVDEGNRTLFWRWIPLNPPLFWWLGFPALLSAAFGGADFPLTCADKRAQVTTPCWVNIFTQVNEKSSKNTTLQQKAECPGCYLFWLSWQILMDRLLLLLWKGTIQISGFAPWTKENNHLSQMIYVGVSHRLRWHPAVAVHWRLRAQLALWSQSADASSSPEHAGKCDPSPSDSERRKSFKTWNWPTSVRTHRTSLRNAADKKKHKNKKCSTQSWSKKNPILHLHGYWEETSWLERWTGRFYLKLGACRVAGVTVKQLNSEPTGTCREAKWKSYSKGGEECEQGWW